MGYALSREALPLVTGKKKEQMTRGQYGIKCGALVSISDSFRDHT